MDLLLGRGIFAEQGEEGSSTEAPEEDDVKLHQPGEGAQGEAQTTPLTELLTR